jgi:hypothetical protein
MAAAAAWLCSDEAAYITGQTFVVDGGPSAQLCVRYAESLGQARASPPGRRLTVS